MSKKEFVWGTSTAAYQIEGATKTDGRGESVWDSFQQHEGRIYDGSNANVACDHYHRYKDDVKLIKNLGSDAYRFSISWTRLFPEGIGKFNQKGADFYSRLIDELLENGVEPFVTLHHWDYPLALYNRGGWLNPDCSKWFAEYAEKVMKLYGDRVQKYTTINEPQTIMECAYNNNFHAPGLKFDKKQQFVVLHNMLLSHGKAAKIIHSYGGQASIAPSSKVIMPAEESAENIEAAREATYSTKFNDFHWSAHYYLDPIMFGKYPDEYFQKYADIIPDIKAEDMKIISEPLDFLCQNIYDGRYLAIKNGKSYILQDEYGAPRTAMDWPITPEVIYWGIRFTSERYKLPLYITENGVAMPDLITDKKKIHDGARIEYMRRYIKQLMKARGEGLPVKGYFYWSLMDNFEWQFGYSKRFGLVYVDYKTLERITKDSYDFYYDIINTDGSNL
ncbi:MAG: GH1 family beta-glucosidase [Christensenellaceae bacterium]